MKKKNTKQPHKKQENKEIKRKKGEYFYFFNLFNILYFKKKK
jgi:hypothetical protein